MNTLCLGTISDAINNFIYSFGWGSVGFALAPIISAIVMIAIAVVIFIIGKKIIKFAIQFVIKGMEKAKIATGVITFTTSLLNIILYGVLIISLAALLGFPTTSFITILGSIGLTVGLALQGSLSNFAGGVLILVLKPFVVGETIDVGGVVGTVFDIDIFYTKVRTPDNRIVIYPNGELSNKALINVSREPERRVDVVLSIGYGDDIKTAKNVLMALLDDAEISPMIIRGCEDKEASVFVASLGESSVNLNLRMWTAKENYFALQALVLEKAKYKFDETGISIPFNQLDVTLIQSK